MSQSPQPNQEPVPSFDARLDMVSQLTGVEDLKSDITDVIDEIFYSPQDGTARFGGFVGGSPEAVAAVHESLVVRLEESAKDGLSGNALRGAYWSIETIFTEPEPAVLKAMERRTDEMERLFSVRELEEAMHSSRDGALSFSGEITHPEFSWVEVLAANQISAIRYKFYKQKPAEGEQRPVSDMESWVRISHMNKNEAPNIVSEEYSTFISTYYSQSRRDNRFKEEVSLDPPEELTPLLSGLAKSMLDDATVDQEMEKVEASERLKEAANQLAVVVVREETDPVRARNSLEEIGIHDDPDNFRNLDS
jgi:hypothetical protein